MVERAGVPTAVNRGAYYFTNLAPLLDAASEGIITTPFPEDLLMPMVSPIDLGKQAAARLRTPTGHVGICYIEGRERYTFLDVEVAFSEALGHAVLLQMIPNDELEASFKELGFSDAAADAYARMKRASVEALERPDDPVRGDIDLPSYLRGLVSSADGSGDRNVLY